MRITWVHELPDITGMGGNIRKGNRRFLAVQVMGSHRLKLLITIVGVRNRTNIKNITSEIMVYFDYVNKKCKISLCLKDINYCDY
jgi:hypothetical protein